MVTLFNYLGPFLIAADDGYPAVIGNLQNAQKSWAQLVRILGW